MFRLQDSFLLLLKRQIQSRLLEIKRVESLSSVIKLKKNKKNNIILYAFPLSSVWNRFIQIEMSGVLVIRVFGNVQ